MAFHLMCVHNILVLFELLSGHLLGGGCSLGWPCSLVFLLFVVLVVSRLVFFLGGGAGFGFWLLQFLVFAFFYFLTGA